MEIVYSVESVDHLFMDCEELDNFWNFIEKSVKILMPSISIDSTSKILGYMDFAQTKHKIFIIFFISIGRFLLWKRRNWAIVIMFIHASFKLN